MLLYFNCIYVCCVVELRLYIMFHLSDIILSIKPAVLQPLAGYRYTVTKPHAHGVVFTCDCDGCGVEDPDPRVTRDEP
jgi:hypothetical protein